MRFSGAHGRYAQDINGIFIPSTSKVKNNLPVYSKSDAKHVKLLFDGRSSKWKIRKLDSIASGIKTIAKVTCVTACKPEMIKDFESWLLLDSHLLSERYVECDRIQVAAIRLAKDS